MMQKFVFNKNNMRFKVCCASCENRILETDGSRCGLAGAKPNHKPDEQCTAYQFRTSLMDAGKEKGRIKKPDYFRFLLEWRDREKASNGKVPPAGLTQIRSEYEKMYGSIYLTQ